MARSYLHTSLALLVAFVSGCGTAGQSNGNAGVPGMADPNAAAHPNSDGDTDSVPADQDLCPNTPAGAAVDGNGCSAAQRDAQNGANGTQSGANGNGAAGSGAQAGANGGASSGGAGNASAGANSAGSNSAPANGTNGAAPADGNVTPNGFATFVLDPKGAVPVTLRTLASNVENLADGGFSLSGTVIIDVPNNQHITLASAKLTLDYDAGKGEGLQSFQGMVALPFPNLGFMQGVSVDNLVYAAVGYDLGVNIQNVDAPIKSDRKYLYFTFSAGFNATIGQLSVSAANNQSVTMTLDPSDPSFFLKASLGGLMGPVNEASVGFSIGGHLPFTPTTTWGIDQNAASFDGHLWIGGQIDLNDLKIPVAIGGNTVVNLDPNGDGKTFFTDPAGGFQFGSNSELDVSISAGVIGLSIPIAQSTIVGTIANQSGAAYYSGMVTAGNGWMPDSVPLKNTAQLKAAGHASSDLSDTYFKAEGDLSLDATKLGQWTGLNLTDLAMAEATLNADQDGLTVSGTASTSISPYIGLKGDLATVGFFDGNPKDWYITLDGKFAVASVELGADAHARIDQTGMKVSGTFQTPISAVSMLGSITQAGVDLEGTASVTIPITGGKEIVQQVTDAAVCGYETVTDASVCGAQTVANGAVCGYSTVTDAAKCGTTVVTDAVKCGTSTVQSAAECGTHTVTDAAVCGYDYFSDALHCGASCIGSFFTSGSCSCSSPASCSVASSCNIANSCNVAATCNIANTCSVPNSCQKVKTCDQHVTVPDFNYGSFTGKVSVKIGNSGLEGSVDGEYCPTGGSCVTLLGGRVKVDGGTPEACVTVDPIGEVCAPF
ncbi:MAG TPA: hypothetical protein VGM44_15315 [Polyangiaceae bacterium]|jgi:hypothetical protein